MSDLPVEYRIFGPPGTGKTTFLSSQIGHAAQKYGSDAVLVTSFTKAAAVELLGRKLPIPKDHVGTLHAHCYRALGAPTIAETKLDEWNKEHPALELSTTGDTIDELGIDRILKTEADEVFAHLGLLRARMTAEDLWPANVHHFNRRWTAWKARSGLMDFTDLLELALRDLRTAPGDPRVIVADEAQDLNRLQMALLRGWGRHAEYILTSGDDDQTIFDWAGASPDAFLTPPVPEEQKRVLSQSWRVPRAVHAASQSWISQVAVREPKEYRPRDADGEVRALDTGNWKYVEPILDDADQYLAAGKTIMFLATCSYMLEPLKSLLRSRALPFHNPYRRKRGDWNPLHPARGASPAERLLALLKPWPEFWGDDAGDWTAGEMLRWLGWVRVDGILQRGAKSGLAKMSAEMPIELAILTELFEPDSLDEFLNLLEREVPFPCIRWWQEHLLVSHKSKVEYPVKIVLQRGVEALKRKPQIIIGTGHSVKGGEADVVYLFPDLSAAAMGEWLSSREQRDSIVRLGYVMMTRARESLILCSPYSAYSMPIDEVVARISR